MSFRPERVREGEWLLAASSVALLVCLLVLPWYGFNSVFAPTLATLGERVQFDGWSTLTVLRFLVLAAVLGGLASWWLQATRPAPAMSVCATVITWGLSLALFIALIVRVLIDPPQVLAAGSGGVNTIQAESGGYVGIALSFVMFAAAYRSLRQEGASRGGASAQIETLRLSRPSPG